MIFSIPFLGQGPHLLQDLLGNTCRKPFPSQHTAHVLGRLILWSSASSFFLFPLSAIFHRKIETSLPCEGVELNLCDQQESRGVHQPGGSDTLGIYLHPAMESPHGALTVRLWENILGKPFGKLPAHASVSPAAPSLASSI